MNPEGIVIKPSRYTVKDTIDRLEDFLRQHGVTIYARIDQQAELNKVGLSIPPLAYILFGDPRAGGPLMVENPLAALDLPLKIIVWEDGSGDVRIAYNEASYIAERYSLQLAANSPLVLDNLVAGVLKG